MRKSIFLALPLALMLSACAGQELPASSTNAPRPVDIDAWTGEMPIADAWLRDELPADIVGYLRIPNPLGLMAIPKGNMLDAALGSEANILNLLGIRQGLAENLAEDSPLFADPRYRALVEHLSSPIEVAVLNVAQTSAVIGMTLDLRSNEALEAMFAELAAYPPLPKLAAPLDADGFGQLAGQMPIPIHVHFDEDTGRLALFGSPTASRASFASFLEPTEAVVEHPMKPFEDQIDESGQGFFVWVDASQTLGVGAMFMPPETLQMLNVTGLDQLRAVAFGSGVADGKGRLKFLADIGTDRTRRPYPVIDNRIGARSVGDPRGLVVLSIPSPAEFARLEALALSYSPPEVAEQWAGIKSELADAMGASLEEILAAVGPELVAFSDRAGNFSAIRVRDSALLNGVLDRIAANADAAIGERRVDGQTIRHVSLPAGGMPENDQMPAEAAAVLGILSRMRSRFYWVEEGDYLYMAGVPQVLMDRANLDPDTDIGAWLANDQHVDLSSAFIGATGTVANLPRTMYQVYMGMMQGMADVADVEYDVWSMPTASELGLPERGTLGFSLNLGEPYLSVEFTFESHPAEALLAGGGSLAAVAAAGIAAAVALPALQEVNERNRGTESPNVAAAVFSAE